MCIMLKSLSITFSKVRVKLYKSNSGRIWVNPTMIGILNVVWKKNRDKGQIDPKTILICTIRPFNFKKLQLSPQTCYFGTKKPSNLFVTCYCRSTRLPANSGEPPTKLRRVKQHRKSHVLREKATRLLRQCRHLRSRLEGLFVPTQQVLRPS